MKTRTKIAIACQGGGSQTAFTAGALKGLCEAGFGQEFDLVSISGTSGGAVCAALLWFAFEKDEAPPWGRLISFWRDNTAQNWFEQAFNLLVVGALRMANSGVLPTLQLSPASPLVQAAGHAATFGHRENFRDFRALLQTHLDFEEIAAWGPRAKRPVLMIGAANVSTGKLAKFISSRAPIRAEHLLASCAVPSIFPAVQIDGEAYWDGLFSDNPPVQELIRPGSVGAGNIPDEIWLIKINPTACAHVPVRPDDILDRRNQLEGNISLFQQLRHLEMLNDMLLDDAFRPEYRTRFDIQAPIRIPKSFAADPDKPYHIPCMEMPPAMQDSLDFESKLDRSAAHIDHLIAAGEACARRFLNERAAKLAATA
ncbi:MAG TPA: patatin-like phospholipase family protein [Acetobacteraceae bacterium]|nr:patatin-like phospholipase family protein [Acetobacteraceae bacterium]